jgi:hypothetical protein
VKHRAHKAHQDDDLPPPVESDRVIVLSGLAGVIILAVMLVWLRSYFFLVRNETIQKNYLSAPNPKIDDLHAHEQQLLNSYGWVDRQKGIVHIPIDQAMELMVRESGRSMTPGQGSVPAPSPGTQGAGTHP